MVWRHNFSDNSTQRQLHAPTTQARLSVFSWWRRVSVQLRFFFFSKCRWKLFNGLMSSVSAAFIDLGWTQHERAIWNSLEGDKWE